MGVEKVKRPLLAPFYTTPSEQIREARVPLTAAQLEAMNATPVSLIPAPGAGYALIVDRVELEIIAGATPFTGGGVITFPYHGTSVLPHSSSIPAADLTGAAGTAIYQLPPPTAVISPPANTGIDITNAAAPFAAGNGSAVALIQYRIIDL
jgi:hypothetical protein